MKRTGRAPEDLPTIQQLEAERNRLRSKNRYNRTLRSTVAILVVVAALAVLVATLWMPVLRIYGTSMFPTLTDGHHRKNRALPVRRYCCVLPRQ